MRPRAVRELGEHHAGRRPDEPHPASRPDRQRKLDRRSRWQLVNYAGAASGRLSGSVSSSEGSMTMATTTRTRTQRPDPVLPPRRRTRFTFVPGEHRPNKARNGLIFLGLLGIVLYSGFNRHLLFLP